MKTSIIIPTYNRLNDLDICLNSVINQTKMPIEIIIVDDSNNDEIENLITKRKHEFEEKNVFLRYIRNEKERSITIARNIGVGNAIGNIILFLDSDVILDKEFLKEILKIYEGKQDVLGVQGHISGICKSPKKIDINRFLFVGHHEKNKCRVLQSTQTTYPSSIDEVISCEWLSGANQSYKKKIFKEFKFDEKLKKYAYKEDVDVSYRIFKRYPDSLFMTPYAKLIHNVSPAGRIPNRNIIYIKEIYSLYFFYKNINQTFKNKLIYLWSRAGYLILILVFQRRKGILQLKNRIDAYRLCIKHLKEIKNGDLEFFRV